MSRVFRLLLFFAASASMAAASTATAPVTKAAKPVARPLPGCSAVLEAAVAAADLLGVAGGATKNSSAAAPYSRTLLANGDNLLETAWKTWECMNGVRTRGFLTLRPFTASSASSSASSASPSSSSASSPSSKRGGGDDDGDLSCSTIDAGIEIDDGAFQEDSLPAVPQVDACRPRFCVASRGSGTERVCEQPFLRTYLDSPAADSAFSPFKAIQLDYEPLGHAPRGIYSDPHFDFHFYYTSRREVEGIERGECGAADGSFLSPESYRKALAPVPLPCFPTGAWTNVGLAVHEMGNHLVNLLSPEFGRFPMRGFGKTLIFGSYDGRINFIELMASRRWLEANSKRLQEDSQQQQQNSLCWDVVGSPSAWPTAGYRPHRYCLEPGSTEKTARIGGAASFSSTPRPSAASSLLPQFSLRRASRRGSRKRRGSTRSASTTREEEQEVFLSQLTSGRSCKERNRARPSPRPPSQKLFWPGTRARGPRARGSFLRLRREKRARE